jgi:hypothetical protein
MGTFVELSNLTSAIGQDFGFEARVLTRSTGSQTAYAPTAALFIGLLAAQYSQMALARTIEHGLEWSTNLVSDLRNHDLFDELVQFHARLASAQKDLPEEAARVLRDNLWQLYA